ncbi:hypothetical protein K9M79_04030 [Candidatus Woesearchaeota archaeon]|nr:hypothetical protein [Candidatus Woesearchaeota archaeon]
MRKIRVTGNRCQVSIELFIIIVLGMFLLLPSFKFLFSSISDLERRSNEYAYSKILTEIVEDADRILITGDGSSELYSIKEDYSSIFYSNNYLYMQKSDIGNISVYCDVDIDVKIVGSPSVIRIVNNNGVVSLW